MIFVEGPVDPSTIPPNLMPIYKTFSTLISQCQERALPMQRRVVEDSARRMQALFQQLVDQQLSPSVIQILMNMCARKDLRARFPPSQSPLTNCPAQ